MAEGRRQIDEFQQLRLRMLQAGRCYPLSLFLIQRDSSSIAFPPRSAVSSFHHLIASLPLLRSIKFHPTTMATPKKSLIPAAEFQRTTSSPPTLLILLSIRLLSAHLNCNSYRSVQLDTGRTKWSQDPRRRVSPLYDSTELEWHQLFRPPLFGLS
jgi:hypothetical protein